MNHLLALTALFVAFLDLGIKLLPRFEEGVLLPGLISLSYTQNTGVSFGLFAGQPWLTLLLSAVLTLIGGWAVRKQPLTRFESLCAGLMLGGAAGNILDRLIHGGVTDYLELLFIRFPVFNLADICLTLGTILLALSLLLPQKGDRFEHH